MTLNKELHPQGDFFVLSLADTDLKSDLDSMDLPFFSPATRPDYKEKIFYLGDRTVSIVPSVKGHATVHDKDVLMYCIAHLMARMDKGLEISPKLTFRAGDFFKATNRRLDGRSYERLEDTLARLTGTVFQITRDDGASRSFDSIPLLAQGGYRQKLAPGKSRKATNPKGDTVRITLSEPIFNAIQAKHVLSIPQEYFRIRSPLNRRLFEIARKHCGNKSSWKIGLDKLRAKVGALQPLKKFRLNIRKLASEPVDLLQYTLEIDDLDMVTFRLKPEVMAGRRQGPDVSHECKMLMKKYIEHHGRDFKEIHDAFLVWRGTPGVEYDDVDAGFITFVHKQIPRLI